MKIQNTILIFCLGLSGMMSGQTTYSYTFDNNTVHVSPTPTVFGVYPPQTSALLTNH